MTYRNDIRSLSSRVHLPIPTECAGPLQMRSTTTKDALLQLKVLRKALHDTVLAGVIDPGSFGELVGC